MKKKTKDRIKFASLLFSLAFVLVAFVLIATHRIEDPDIKQVTILVGGVVAGVAGAKMSIDIAYLRGWEWE